MKPLPGFVWNEVRQRYFPATSANSGYDRQFTESVNGKKQVCKAIGEHFSHTDVDLKNVQISTSNDIFKETFGLKTNTSLLQLLQSRRKSCIVIHVEPSIAVASKDYSFKERGIDVNNTASIQKSRKNVSESGGRNNIKSRRVIPASVNIFRPTHDAIRDATLKLSVLDGPRDIFWKVVVPPSLGLSLFAKLDCISRSVASRKEFAFKPGSKTPFALSDAGTSEVYIAYCNNYCIACENLSACPSRSDPHFTGVRCIPCGGQHISSLKFRSNTLGFTATGQGSLYGRAEIYSLGNRFKCVLDEKIRGDLWDMSWCMTDQRAVIAGDYMKLLDLEGQREIWQRNSKRYSPAMCIDKHSRSLHSFVSGHRNGCICIWDTRSPSHPRKDSNGQSYLSCTSLAVVGWGLNNTPNLCATRHFGTKVVLRDLRKSGEKDSSNVIWEYNSNAICLGDLTFDESHKRFVCVGSNKKSENNGMGSDVMLYGLSSPNPVKTFSVPDAVNDIHMSAPSLICQPALFGGNSTSTKKDLLTVAHQELESEQPSTFSSMRGYQSSSYNNVEVYENHDDRVIEHNRQTDRIISKDRSIINDRHRISDLVLSDHDRDLGVNFMDVYSGVGERALGFAMVSGSLNIVVLSNLNIE